MADPRELPDSEFWRQWNSRAANQLSAASQGIDMPAPDFGQFEADYAYNQRLAALPFKDQQTALMNQYQMQQGQARNQLAALREQRMMEAGSFNQAMTQRRLQSSQQAAAASQLARARASQIRNLEGEYKQMGDDLGANPRAFLQNFSRETGMAEIPGDPSKVGSMPIQIKGDLDMFNRVARLHNALNQARGLGDDQVNYLYTPEQESSQAFNTLPPDIAAAMIGAQSGRGIPRGFSSEKQRRLEELAAKSRQIQSQPFQYELTPQDYAAPN